MRIVGGAFRGRPLATPKTNAIRPTTDRAREAVFNVIAHRYPDHLDGARVLDQPPVRQVGADGERRERHRAPDVRAVDSGEFHGVRAGRAVGGPMPLGEAVEPPRQPLR